MRTFDLSPWRLPSVLVLRKVYVSGGVVVEHIFCHKVFDAEWGAGLMVCFELRNVSVPHAFGIWLLAWWFLPITPLQFYVCCDRLPNFGLGVTSCLLVSCKTIFLSWRELFQKPGNLLFFNEYCWFYAIDKKLCVLAVCEFVWWLNGVNERSFCTLKVVVDYSSAFWTNFQFIRWTLNDEQ
jgi:hypothetical protein